MHYKYNRILEQTLSLVTSLLRGNQTILTFPTGWSFGLSGFEWVFIRNNRSFAKSRVFSGVCCPEKSALYPNEKILVLQSSTSLPSHTGQKLWGSRSQDQVPLDVPPSPWTKIRSTRGSGNA